MACTLTQDKEEIQASRALHLDKGCLLACQVAS